MSSLYGKFFTLLFVPNFDYVFLAFELMFFGI